MARVADFPSFLAILGYGGPGAYAGAAHQDDKLAMLADDLRDQAKADLASHGNGPSEGRGRGRTHRSDRADDARIKKGSNGSVDGRTSAAITTVPESSTLVLFGIGLLTTAMWTRRRIAARTIDR